MHQRLLVVGRHLWCYQVRIALVLRLRIGVEARVSDRHLKHEITRCSTLVD